jgi:hypothetical protein
LAFRQQQAAQRPQIVQDPAAGGDVQGQLGQIVADQLERLAAALGPVRDGYRDIGIHVLAGLFNGFREEGNVFLRIFDAVKRRFRIVAHICLLGLHWRGMLVAFTYSRTKARSSWASFPGDWYRCRTASVPGGLLPRATLRILQVGLAPFGLGTLGFADRKGAAAQIFGFVGFVFCQSNLLEGDLSILAGQPHGGPYRRGPSFEGR